MSEPVSMNVHNEAMKRLDAENERQNKRLSALEENYKEINKIASSVERMAVSIEIMTQELSEQGEQLKELQSRDGQMWRTVVTHALTLFVGAVMAYVLAKVGL